jgi:pimeloyl-ACP methyl ester carboxylesterase
MSSELSDSLEASRGSYLSSSDSGRVFILSTAAKGDAIGDVLIIPPFGTSAHELFTVALYLGVNGFNVTRFDGRDHVGRGTGEIPNFRLSQLEADTAMMLSNRASGSRLPLVLVGISLSAPVAWRAALRSEFVSGVATLVGVVDVRDTVMRVAGVDIDLLSAPSSRPDTIVDVFGYPILGTHFSRDSASNRYSKLSDTIDVVSRVRCPLHMVNGAVDEYVNIRLVEKVAKSLPPRSKLTVLDGISHEIGRSISATKLALGELVARCKEIVGHGESPVVLPKVTELVRASGAESDYLRRLDELETES